MRSVLLVIFSCCSLWADENPILEPALCKGIVLLSAEDELKETPRSDSFLSSELEIPGGERLEKRLHPLFLNREINPALIADIKKEISTYFEEQNHSLTAIRIPEQKICAGVIQVVICESSLNCLSVKGNCWTSSKQLETYFKTDCGGMFDDRILRSDLEFMNRNPFRHVNAVLSPGKSQNTTDVTLLVEERRQARFYAGADNTGVRTTGRQRFYAGLNWGKAFGFDHIFSYQYTSSYELNKFQAHSAQYQAFLPWKHVLDIYGGYSYLRAHLGFTPSTSSGQSGQASLRYTIPFMPWTSFTHELSVGFDFKRTNNTVQFSDLFIHFAKNVNLTQLALRYRLEKTFSNCRLDLDTEAYYSPGNWVPDQTVSDYNALRPFARPAYAYFRAAFNSLFYLPRSYYLNFLLRGQVATQNLLPSEQCCVGGYDTVRGYDQWQLNVDDALLFSGELRSPHLRIFSRKCDSIKDVLQFLVFADFGYGKNYKPIPHEKTPQYLIGVGPGVRYTWDPYIAARLDYGFKCHENSEFTGGNGMVHFNVTLSY